MVAAQLSDRATTVARTAPAAVSLQVGSAVMWTKSAKQVICRGGFGRIDCDHSGGVHTAAIEFYGLAGRSWRDASGPDGGSHRAAYRYLAWSTIWRAYQIVPHTQIAWCSYDNIASVAALLHHCATARRWYAEADRLLARDPAAPADTRAAEQNWLRITHC